MGINQIASLIFLAVDTLNRVLAARAKATGKTHGELLRDALGQNKANDVLALQIIAKAQALKGAAPTSLTSTQQIEANLAEIRHLISL